MTTNAKSLATSKWLVAATKRLEQSGIGTARLDCLVLLEDAVGHDRAWLLAHSEFELTGEQIDLLDNNVRRRTEHEPLAYIRGKTEFYGREFIVNSAVLEPRPESETMIDILKSLDLSKTPALADVGSGSGAIGLTAALEIPGSTIDLYDIDTNTLIVARKNMELHKVTARLYQNDLLKGVQRSYGAILANLPYVPDSYHINEAALKEPRIAIFGGIDGLDLYRNLFMQLEKSPNKPEYVLTESLPFQHQELRQIAEKHGFSQLKNVDFIQLFKPS